MAEDPSTSRGGSSSSVDVSALEASSVFKALQKKASELAPKGFAAVSGESVIVLRHSVRQDTHPSADVRWDEAFTRPFDPPISDCSLPVEVYTTELGSAKLDTIVCSPLLRCLQTAALIGAAADCRTFVIDDRICEDRRSLLRCIRAGERKALEAGVDVQCTDEDIDFLSLAEATVVIESFLDGTEPVTVSLKRHSLADASSDSGRRKPLFGEHIAAFKEAVKHRLHSESGSERSHTLVVTHGAILSDTIGFQTDGVITKADECGWVAFDSRLQFDAYSIKRMLVIYDPKSCW